MTPAEKINVKIIAIDLDDTLLKDNLTISDYSVSILQKAAQKGIYITLCSGRTSNAILPFIRRLDTAGLTGGRYMITQNGTSIFDLHTRQTIYSRCLEPEVAYKSYIMAKEKNLIYEVYSDSTIFVEKHTKWSEIDVQLSGLHLEIVPDFENFLKKGFPKMVIPGEPEELLAFQELLRTQLADKAVIFTSKPYFLEVLPAASGKGQALQHLAETCLGIPREQTMAFGDSMNDESMIRYAGHSVAMTNGLPQIQRMAKYVTEFSNNEDGVARFIEKWCL